MRYSYAGDAARYDPFSQSGKWDRIAINGHCIQDRSEGTGCVRNQLLYRRLGQCVRSPRCSGPERTTQDCRPLAARGGRAIQHSGVGHRRPGRDYGLNREGERSGMAGTPTTREEVVLRVLQLAGVDVNSVERIDGLSIPREILVRPGAYTEVSEMVPSLKIHFSSTHMTCRGSP